MLGGLASNDPANYLNLERWMSRLPNKLQHTPLNLISIPGSHDSGSYSLDAERGLAPDRSWDGPFSVMHICPHLMSRWIVKKWFKTQRVDLREQLDHGIRYLDLRVAPYIDDELYFVHGLYADKILDLCRMVNNFLDDNTQEIVFLDFQHFHEVSPDQHHFLINRLIEMFGSKICPYIKYKRLEELTLIEMWAKRYQIIIFYRKDDMVERYTELWPGKLLPNPWADTASITKLIPFLWNGLMTRSGDTFFVSQGILSPHRALVMRNIGNNLYSKLTKACNQRIQDWLLEVKRTNFTPNIVMCDFVDFNDYVIPKRTILINYDYLDVR